MGTCNSSNDQNQGSLSNTGLGLPPKEIIPQPVEVSNIEPDLANQIITPGDQLAQIETIQNQQFNSINSGINPTNQEPLNVSNPNISNSLNQNINNLNQNISGSLNPNINNSLNLNGNPINGSFNNNFDLGNTVAETQLIKGTNFPGNGQMTGLSQGNQVLQSYPGGSKQLINKSQANSQRVYLVVQLPQREIEITKLYDYYSMADIGPYIAPDSIDEYDFYDDKGNLIEDRLYTPFKNWHNNKYTLRIKLVRSGLHVSNDIRLYIAKRTYLIGYLTFDRPNTFGLFIFNKNNNSTLSFEYSTNIYILMKAVNQFSAYCNALNKLYISGGEISNNQASDTFISIDLTEVEPNTFIPHQLCNLVKKRYWHSMIFIPQKYIFIVGGPNEMDVELYDIKKNISKVDSQLNTERCEPSLILVNDKFLYAIFGFHLYDSFINTIERCNIHRKNRVWEMVDYKLNNTPNLVKAFFGVSYVKNNIILVSDKESQNDLKPNYILYPGRDNDTINEEGVLNSRSSRLFAEKFFIPFTENESINLAFKSGEPKIFIVNNENGIINELCLNESQ